MIDLRSDTVTLPTNEMKQFIMDSPLGDDVYGEDPSVNLLQKKIAKIFNKESALFVPSGTMANLISVLTHCNRGDEVILGNKSHIFFYEAGGISAFGGVHSHQINNNDDGTININDIENAIRKTGDDHFPKTKLICLENTHNACYGSPINTDFFSEVKNIAKKHNIPIHLDGARIFNAAIALNKSVDELTKDCDSVSCCLSKGLSAPVGSVILGSKNFISKAKSLRKALGGGMRQAGLIASAGIFSLDHMINRIKDDHSNAKILASKLNLIKNLEINLNQVHTNIIFIYNRDRNLSNQDMLLSLEKNNIKIDYKGNSKFRLVTHSGFRKEDINAVIKIFRKIFKD